MMVSMENIKQKILRKLKEETKVDGDTDIVMGTDTYKKNQTNLGSELKNKSVLLVPQNDVNQSGAKAEPYKAPDAVKKDNPTPDFQSLIQQAVSEDITSSLMEPTPPETAVGTPGNLNPSLKPPKPPTGPGPNLMGKIKQKPDVQVAAEKVTQLPQKIYSIMDFMKSFKLNKMQMGQLMAKLGKLKNQMQTEGVNPKMKKKDLMELIKNSNKLEIVETIKIKDLIK